MGHSTDSNHTHIAPVDMNTRSRGSAGGGGEEAAAALGGSGAAVSLNGDTGGGGGGQSADGEHGAGPGHSLPGYAAGFDAGYLAGLLAASTDRAPPPIPVPAAAEGGADSSDGSAPPRPPPRPPFLALLEDFPDLFQKEVLERLDRGVLGRTGSAVRTAVKLSGLARVGGSASGPRVSISSFCRSLPQLVWAIANGCPWLKTSTCSAIAEGGQLEVLQWARVNGCPWDKKTCYFAAQGGHLTVLQWAREQGCPWGGSNAVLNRRSGRAPGGVAVGAGAWLPVELDDL